MIRLFIISILIAYAPLVHAQNDSIADVLSQLRGEEKAKVIKDYVNFHQNDTDSYLFELIDQGIEVNSTLNSTAYDIAFQRLMGSLFLARKKYDTSLIILNQALRKSLEFNLKDEIGEINGVLGSVYYKTGAMESAIQHWLPTLTYLEDVKKNYSLGFRLTQIGNAYLMLEQVETGIAYNKKALDIDAIQKKDRMLGRVYNSLGYGYDELQQYDSAIYFYEKSYQIGVKNNDAYRMGISRINICSALESQDKFEETRQCITETIDFLKANNMNEYLIHMYTTLLNAQLNTNLNTEASQTVDSIKHYLSIYPTENIRFQLPKMESMVLEARGDYKTALDKYKRYAKLTDSVASASKLEEIEELRLVYETEKKDEKIRVVKQENVLKDQRNKRTQFLWVISSLALLLLFGFILIANNRRLLKKKKELAESKVEHQLEVLKATIEGQELERKRIARELHDGIGQQITAIKYTHESLVKQVDEQTQKMSDLIQRAAQDVRSLSHQMMPKVLQDIGLEAAIKDLTDGIQTQNGLVINCTTRYKGKRLGEQQEINLYRIYQELLNNALKHSEATEISVMFYQADSNLILMVDDNGKGADYNQLEGHGMMNLSSRASTIGAKYFIETAIGKGFTFTLKLPLD